MSEKKFPKMMLVGKTKKYEEGSKLVIGTYNNKFLVPYEQDLNDLQLGRITRIRQLLYAKEE